MFKKKLFNNTSMTVKIICDTSADLNLQNDETLYEKYDIEWVPMQVMFGTEAFKELVDLKTSDFYEKLTTTDVHPTTSQSTQADLLAAYEKFADKADEIISLHLSGEISGAVANALMARKMYEKQNPDGAKIHIYDSRMASTPFGQTVLKATQLAKEGLKASEIIPKLDEWRTKNQSWYFTVGDLKWLFEGGRLSRTKYVLGSLLSKNPVLKMIDGKIEPMKSGSGLDKTLQMIVEMMIEDLQTDPSELTLHFTQAEFYNETKEYAAKFEEMYPGLKIGKIFTLGGVIAAHTGPGTIVPVMTKNFEY